MTKTKILLGTDREAGIGLYMYSTVAPNACLGQSENSVPAAFRFIYLYIS